jgi:hypothetical protein
MAPTTLSDVWVPEVFASYQINDPVEGTALVDSGVIATNGLFNELANGPGRTTTLPFWNDLDSTVEPNYSNDVYADIAEPQNVSMGEQTARVSDLNEGWGSADLVTQLTGKDPLALVAAKVDNYWRRQFQRRVIATAIGVWNDNVAADGGDMTIDISSANMTVVAGNQFNSSSFVNAALTLGDHMDSLSAIAVHSVVYGRLLKDDLITFIPNSQGKLTIPTYMGKTVIVDDGMPIVGGDGTTVAYKYLCIMFGPGAIGYGSGQPKVPSEYERAPARGNGGGFETLWSRKKWVIHPLGYTFTSTTITGPGYSPTWADLKLATNWTRIQDRKTVPMAFLIVNA